MAANGREAEPKRHAAGILEPKTGNAELTTRVAQLQATLTAVLDSQSWRWMAPMRGAGALVRVLFGGGRR